MKYLKAILGVALLATLLSVPTGCGSGGKIEKKEGGVENPQPEGHAAAAKALNEKPAGVK